MEESIGLKQHYQRYTSTILFGVVPKKPRLSPSKTDLSSQKQTKNLKEPITKVYELSVSFFFFVKISAILVALLTTLLVLQKNILKNTRRMRFVDYCQYKLRKKWILLNLVLEADKTNFVGSCQL